MPRLPEVLDRNALPEDKREIHDYLAETRGAVRLPFSAFLNNPELTYRIAHVGSYIRFDGRCPTRLASSRSWPRRGRSTLASSGPATSAGQGARRQRGDDRRHRQPHGARGPQRGRGVAGERVAQELLREHELSDELFNAAQAKYRRSRRRRASRDRRLLLPDGLHAQRPADRARRGRPAATEVNEIG